VSISTERSRPAPWVRITLGVVVGLLLAYAGYWVWKTITTCAHGVDRIESQCIGVTDGRVVLSEDLKGVLSKIHQENERIDNSGQPAVSIAYLIPVPRSPHDRLVELLRHELEGAYIAQLRANQSATGPPLLRLLVANYGDAASEWERVTRSVLGLDQSEHLVAAVVTGRTLDNTIRAIDALKSGGIPVVASRLTGNKLTFLAGPTVQGLARVAPTNSDQAMAVALFLKQNANRALLVQDSNPSDTYLLSLGDAFRANFVSQGHELLAPTEFYNSQLPGVESQMKRILRNICVQKPDVVFFVGRTPAVKAFIAASPTRPCFDVPIRVVAGADAAEFSADLQDDIDLRNALAVKPGNAEVSLTYTSQASPGSWGRSPGSFASDSMFYLDPRCEGDRCYRNLFLGEQMDDGAAIIGHDAMTIVASAIHSPNGVNDKPGLIMQEFNSMRGDGAVPGASGWISLDENGNTVNKAVAILQVKSDGTVQWLGLSSRIGSPCVPKDVPRLC
jgi:ABC-type branched-subunit amino acid transport system substrate-binding protein